MLTRLRTAMSRRGEYTTQIKEPRQHETDVQHPPSPAEARHTGNRAPISLPEAYRNSTPYQLTVLRSETEAPDLIKRQPDVVNLHMKRQTYEGVGIEGMTCKNQCRRCGVGKGTVLDRQSQRR
jgi:hypothetical protein